MNESKRVSIKGNFKKCGSTWTATVPGIKVSSRGSSPSECFESLKGMIQILGAAIPFEFDIEINDHGVLVISSKESEIFLAFVKSRIILSQDQENFLAELKG